MKTNYILYLIILYFSMMSCDNLSENQRTAQKYMMQIARKTNEMMNLPSKVDDFTYAEIVQFDKKTNTIIYTYIIDKDDYGSESEFQNIFEQIQDEQFARARENQGNNQYYSELGVTIRSIYKNDKNDILYSFDITPTDYIQTEIKDDKGLNNLIPDDSIKLDFRNGLSYEFGNMYNEDKTDVNYVTISSFETTTLNLILDIGNPFGEIIESTELEVEILLKYQAGRIKFRSNNYNSLRSLSRIEQLTEFDVSDFFLENSTTNLEELQRYADYLSIIYTDRSRVNTKDKEAVKRNEASSKFNTEIKYKYSKNDLIRLDSLIKKFDIYFDSNENYNYFKSLRITGYETPNIIDTKTRFTLRLFKDFQLVNEPGNINYIPTINKFKLESAKMVMRLIASNTNGFYFNDIIKTFDITEKWNNHFINNPTNEK